ncbi:respiratory nitrate reductase subunit gamma [Desulfomicrobium sp. ZS1]|jgi:nitrate reductase gamma subunit|uniref:TmcC family electron transfer complex membrane anchor subunit n=1 Tax=Desulfomicrobium sp. ZS1 TaxID=2952228 RepID=UPI0020B1BA0C|nr:respiratory nitrate reductase subunit gamma [Desulfomicrobium sp. ZS1]UTF50870.1 respiratory nitrate reductase subunit gamma [Desulfomicrobium sp. ZS1]
MQDVYLLVSGPLAWAAWTIFVLGSIYKIWSTLNTARKKDQVLLNYVSFRYGMRSIINWSIPFNTVNMRLNPVFTGIAFFFHIAFFVLLIFVSAHQIMIEEGFGIGWFTIPDFVADILAFAVIGACIFFAVRRVMRPEVSYVTDWTDFALLALVAAPFVTGVLAYHQLGNYMLMVVLHMVSAELLLVAIPFTRLSHMLLAPLTRAYIGSEFGMVRHVKDW